MSLDVQQHAPDGSGLKPIEGPQVWYGPDMATRQEEWCFQWSDAEIAEIEGAVAAVLARDLDILDIGRDDFPLPTVAARLSIFKDQVLRGLGFCLIQGLPVERWTMRQAATAYWGLGLYIGEACSQNGKGHVLGHVKNLGLEYDNPQVRGYQTSARLPYHTDSCDIAALLCWRTSKSGGQSSIVSSTTVYNEILKRRPDLLAELLRPFHRTRWGEVPAGKNPWAEVPVFMPHGDRVVSHYVRSAIRKGQLLDNVPKLNAARLEALDYLDELTNDPDLHMKMTFQPGDIQMVCNHWLFHSRTSYEDWPEPERRRHLLRLWLACADGPSLPDWLTQVYAGSTASGRPNGIEVPGVPHLALLSAE